MYAKDAIAVDAKPSTVFRLYVDGQLGLRFDSLDTAAAAAKSFNEECFDTMIVEESRPKGVQGGDW